MAVDPLPIGIRWAPSWEEAREMSVVKGLCQGVGVRFCGGGGWWNAKAHSTLQEMEVLWFFLSRKNVLAATCLGLFMVRAREKRGSFTSFRMTMGAG